MCAFFRCHLSHSAEKTLARKLNNTALTSVHQIQHDRYTQSLITHTFYQYFVEIFPGFWVKLTAQDIYYTHVKMAQVTTTLRHLPDLIHFRRFCTNYLCDINHWRPFKLKLIPCHDTYELLVLSHFFSMTYMCTYIKLYVPTADSVAVTNIKWSCTHEVFVEILKLFWLQTHVHFLEFLKMLVFPLLFSCKFPALWFKSSKNIFFYFQPVYFY